MKKSLLIFSMVALLGLCFVLLSSVEAASVEAKKNTEMAQVPYAKWGRLAVSVAKETFPDYDVSDYKYIGREQKTETTAVDRFELILTKNAQKRDIVVNVLFNTQTGELISLDFQEK